MDTLAVPAVDDDNQVLDGTNASKSGVEDEPSTDVKQAAVVSKKPKVVRRFTDAEKLRAIAVAKKKSVAMASQTLGIPERNIKRWLHIPDEQLTKMKLKISGTSKPTTKAFRRPPKPIQAAVIQKKVLQAVTNALAKKPTVPSKVAEPEPLTKELIVERQEKIILLVHVINKELSEHSRRTNIPPPPAVPMEFTQGAGKTDPASTDASTEYHKEFQTWMDEHVKKS